MNTQVPAMAVAIAMMFGASAVVSAEYGQEHEKTGEERLTPEQEPMAEDAEVLTDEAETGETEGILLRATNVTGFELRDQEGAKIGGISDLAIDSEHDKVAYVIIQLDEGVVERDDEEGVDPLAAVGLGGDRYAVPWQGLSAASGKDAMTLTIDLDQLAQAELFDDQWEHFNDRERATAQHEQFGFDPYWESEDAVLRVESLSDLRGREIRDIQQEAVADIHDLMIDSREGHLAYAVLGYGGLLGIGQEYVAVPYQALQPDFDEEVFVLAAEQETLELIAFGDDDWPNMTDEQWAQRVHDAFDQEPYWQVFGYTPPHGESAESQQAEEEHDAGVDRE